jgi:ABC-type glycerol-3-phosphate transport system substrate-binding protein
MLYRRPLLAFLALAVLITPLAACGQATPPPEPVEITFRHAQEDANYYKGQLETFNEADPHITVNLRSQGSAEDADCFVGQSYDVPQFVENESVVNLNPFLDQDQDFQKEDFVPGILSTFTTENKLWAVPSGFNPAVMYFNRDLFDQRGVAYPTAGWTMDDFVAAASAITDPENETFGYATPQSGDSPDVLMFVYALGGKILDSLIDPTRATFDDPKTIAAVEWYDRLVNEYNAAPTLEQMQAIFGGSGREVGRGIIENRVGMWVGWYGDRGGQTWPVKWDMNWGMLPLPRGETPVTMAFADGYFISANSENAEACWKWISHLSRQPHARLVPARKSVVESEAYGKLAGREIADVARAAVESAVLISPDLARFENVIMIFYTALAGVLAGQLSAEEAMVFAQQEWEKSAPQ